jgi:hypothetical protein
MRPAKLYRMTEKEVPKVQRNSGPVFFLRIRLAFPGIP